MTGLSITIESPPITTENNGIISFKQVASAFGLAPKTAVDFFKGKGLKETFVWQDMVGEEHAKAFTVAKMMDMDLLSETQSFLNEAIANGKTQEWFVRNLTPHLQAKGWWGKKDVLDPLTGLTGKSQLGSAPRLNTIFRTNMQSSYSVGHWEQIQENQETAEWLLYDAVDDHRTRSEHNALDGTVLKVDDPFWEKYYPPNGWNCRCSAIQMSQEDLDEFGIQENKPPQVESKEWINPRTGHKRKVPENLDPGWDINMGKLHQESLVKTMAEKVAVLDDGKQKAVKKMMADIDVANSKLASEIGKASMERLKNKTNLKILEAKNKKWLADIASGKEKDPGKFFLKAKKQLEKNVTFPANSFNDQAKLIKKLSAELKAKNTLAGVLSGYKKKILEGKAPTPAQKKAFDTLDQDKKDLFLAKIKVEQDKVLDIKNKAAIKEAQDAAKELSEEQAKEAAKLAAKAPAAKPKVSATPVKKPATTRDKDINMEDMTQIGGQGGSNTGGLYQNTETGEKFYIKFPGNEATARNEVLASKMYELAGVENTGKAHLFKTQDGKTGIASEFIEALEVDKDALLSGKIHGIDEGFAADAWLANWDAVGLEFDNLLVKGKHAYRIDPGGALEFRAQGGKKGAAFGDKVLELESFRNNSMNPQSASVFGRISREKIIDGVRKIAAIDDNEMWLAIHKYGHGTPAAKKKLFNKMKARRDHLLEEYPEARKAPVADTNVRRERVTELDLKQVEAARINGYSIPTDKGDIEDHNVTFTQMKDAKGESFTRMWMKLTPEGMRKIKGAQSQNKLDDEGLFAFMIKTLKGLNSQPNGNVRAVDIDRAKAAIQIYDRLIANNGGAAEFIKHYSGWIDDMRAVTQGTQKWNPKNKGILVKYKGKLPKKKTEDGAVVWTPVEDDYKFQLSVFDKSNAKHSGNGNRLTDGRHMKYQSGDINAIYFPDSEGTNFSIQGFVQVDIKGGSTNGLTKGIDFIEDLGITPDAPTRAIHEELYLDQLAGIINIRNIARQAEYRLINKDLSIGSRVDKKKKILSNNIAVRDISKSKSYEPEGKRQAFDHGRVRKYRPDLDTPEFRKFSREHVIYNNPIGLSKEGRDITDQGMLNSIKSVIGGGGQISSQTDRVRRGIRLTSEAEDFNTGGANYVFTRIKRRSEMGSEPGIYWKADEIKRMDSISYSGDQYGRTTGSTVEELRQTTIKQFEANATRSRDELIFKDGLSYFDNLEKIVFPTEKGRKDAIKLFKENGFTEWPDGRKLESVLVSRKQRR